MNHHGTRTGYALTVLSLLTIVTALPSARAVTVTLTYDDPCSVMGALNDADGDAFGQVALSPAGPSKPYISTPFAGGSYAAARRGIAEFALEPLRDLSWDPNAVSAAILRFYFDDVIFPDNSPEPYTTQDFSVECYTDGANGSVDGTDPNDRNPAAVGEGADDWEGAVVQSWRFLAGAVEGLPPGQRVAGVFGPDEPFPAAYGDDQLAIFGIIGFEIDVAEALRAVLADETITHIGFRWLSNTDGGYWTSMDPADYLPSLAVDVTADQPLHFALQSTDGGAIEGNHGGRPYHVAGNPDDEAIYLTVGEWSVGHEADVLLTWPVPDGIVSWPVFSDPNQALDAPEALTHDADGNVLYVYRDTQTQEYLLLPDERNVPAAWEKVYYERETDNASLTLGNTGRPDGAMADRQQVLLSEFNLTRPGRYGLDPNRLLAATVELTVDRVIDMSLNGNNLALLPTALFVNAYAGDGILDNFTNVQADVERINHAEADAVAWLTMDGTMAGQPITDFALSYYRLVDPGTGGQFTLRIDVTDAVKRLLQEGADYAGFVFSCSSDGEFTLASIDLVDTINGETYLPTLVLETDLQ